MTTKLDQMSPEEKRFAMDQALASHTLARSEKLRSLLRYVCGREIEGRSEEISEYSIAVEALGRPVVYSATEDSSVRNRVFALRKKLDELYGVELADAPVRIELAKGTYRPRFVRLEDQAVPPAPVMAAPVVAAAPVREPAEPAAPVPVVAAPIPEPRHRPLPAFLAGVGVAGLLALTAYLLLGTTKPDPVLREAWGPLLDPAANVAVVFSVGAGLAVRPYDNEPAVYNEFPVTEAPGYLYAWYKMRHPVPAGKKLYMVPSHSQPSMGSVLSTTSAVSFLTKNGVSFEVLPETLMPVGATRNRNIILMGTAENSEGMRRLQTKAPFDVVFDQQAGDYAVAERDGARRVFHSRRDAGGKLVEAYGLLTVLPSEGSDGHRRTVLISGTYSAAISAAMDFFCSEVKMHEFRQILQKDGQRGFPEAYQLVVRATTDHVLPLGSRYETHRAMQ